MHRSPHNQVAVLLAKVGTSRDCWEWPMAKSKGYGTTHIDGVQKTVHVVVYEALIGPVPEGLELDHLCKNKACCNPAHLEPVTHHENLMRSDGPAAKNAAKTHCLHGHELAGDNLYVPANGSRQCRECRRNRKKEKSLAQIAA